jgi:hypothetical protein
MQPGTKFEEKILKSSLERLREYVIAAFSLQSCQRPPVTHAAGAHLEF